jgi:hypothetical protein
MDKKPDNPTTREAWRQPAANKLPYQKPAFRYERVFETMALACGKISVSQGQCAFLLKSS